LIFQAILTVLVTHLLLQRTTEAANPQLPAGLVLGFGSFGLTSRLTRSRRRSCADVGSERTLSGRPRSSISFSSTRVTSPLGAIDFASGSNFDEAHSRKRSLTISQGKIAAR